MSVENKFGTPPHEKKSTQEIVLQRLEDAYMRIPPFDLSKPRHGPDGLIQQREVRLEFLREYQDCAHNLHPDQKEKMATLQATTMDESYQLRQAIGKV